MIAEYHWMSLIPSSFGTASKRLLVSRATGLKIARFAPDPASLSHRSDHAADFWRTCPPSCPIPHLACPLCKPPSPPLHSPPSTHWLLGDYRWLSWNISWLSLNIAYYRWISLNIVEHRRVMSNIVEYRWLSLNIVEYIWWTLNIVDYRWIQYHCLSMNIIEYGWWSSNTVDYHWI